jgi:hypothetical protein
LELLIPSGFRDMTPFNSEDLTELVVEEGGKFVVLRSSEEAEDDPDYEELSDAGCGERISAILSAELKCALQMVCANL